MNMETIRELQAYGYIFFTIFLAVILYSYLYHLYKAEKKGTRNYEQYSNIALHDNLDDAPVESRTPSNKEKE
ncbi:cytochrome c oxidase, cbb3-type, CcoQ subunit [Sulfurospirillum deleyianum DSM 6946]|uniref:Cytochrome c oxidase, cbb3-type, CcoQ subunit n=2 Tax=Sulfurospirillum deleyianum TaxID=65553 RepID=D1B4B2_SULD5|nr:cytochrome c oxidase, cbb3-type, CcoQ subunit [Sulfurospirillum deleyianum DSM 6946]